MLEKIDTAITNISEWINAQTAQANYGQESSMLPEMISALAGLIKARAEMLG